MNKCASTYNEGASMSINVNYEKRRGEQGREGFMSDKDRSNKRKSQETSTSTLSLLAHY